MDGLDQLIAQLHREDIEQARQMTEEEKLRAGAELFDYACSITAAGIREEYPTVDEAEVRRIIRERLERAERIEGRLGELL